MLHKEYERKGIVEKISGREPQGAWHQDELIGGNSAVVKQFWLWIWVQWIEVSWLVSSQSEGRCGSVIVSCCS
jgi:hypothetical protein